MLAVAANHVGSVAAAAAAASPGLPLMDTQAHLHR